MRRNLLATTAIVGATIALSACGGGDSTDQASTDRAVAEALASQAAASTAPPTAASTATPTGESTADPAESAKPAATAKFVEFAMPNFVGMNLQDAQDRVQELGIFYSISHDLNGSRMQVLDRSWQVCDQSPRAGTRITGAADEFEGKFDFGTVKADESCP
ncbi:PASTA domain-containing protein [Sporichthya sp.]|uniref:PASTA domain-containing protein n=1 Tax=Sporichthya sp. TaxID=65475 RepID=UPI001794C079|nr:PASTA domain-containing protein [Sporichthya sp.]MBA3745398.1 PASTA domain-containing protein [Sporichthya sp.]